MLAALRAPGAVLGLANHGDEVFALIRVDGPTRPPRARLARLDGDAFTWCTHEGPAPACHFATSPQGPWLVIEAVAHALWAFARRSLPHAGRVAFVGTDPIVAGEGGLVTRADAWSARVVVDALAFPGVVELRRDTRWQPAAKPAWAPQTWEPYDAPLVCDDLVLVRFCEWSSGLGIAAALACDDGRELWRTAPQPLGACAAFPGGGVAVGAQGYGAFRTELRDASPNIQATWPSHGAALADPTRDALIVLEMDNANADRGRVVRLERRGVVVPGDALPGFYTSAPARWRGDAIVFARADALWQVDPATLRATRLATLAGARGVWTAPTLATADAVLVSEGDTLWRWRP